MTTSHFFLTAWTLNAPVLIAAAVALNWYLGAFRLTHRAGWFTAGIALLILTLLSPLNTLANGYLFSAHMAQHILLLLVIPALLLMGLPAQVSLPNPWHLLATPITGWIAGMGAMWIWHVPFMCNAAVISPAIHTLQTISLLALGTIFWWQILSPCPQHRLSPPLAVLYLGTACAACSVLGIIITLSPVTVCSIYTMPPGEHSEMMRIIRCGWGITPDKDQQIGGLLMWIPMCFVYLAAIIAQLAQWFAEPVVHLKGQI